MGGGGKSSTSTSTVTIPPEVLARYNSVNATAQNVAQTPFQPYSSNPSDFVAPVNSTQQQGINQIAGNANAAQPFFGAAAGLTAAGAGPANLGGLNTNQYMSPFMGDVYGQALAGQQLQNQQQQSNLAGQAVTAGAFGGDRANTAQANLAYQQNLANNQTNANLLNTGYQNAQNVATQQQGAQLAAQQANLARLTGAGGQLAGIGTAAQTAAQQGGQNTLAAGTVPQQTQQAGLTALYNQFLQQQAYPFQTTQFLANIAEGTGALSGSTTTQTQPSSFFSDRRLKHDIKKIGKTDDGLPIYKFRYKGDPSEQIHVGFMAQDVEKVHPEAVGESHGYKTVDYDKATRHARYAGGLIPHHMGGEVNEGHMGEEYARGGYALNGAVVDPSDMAAILAAQQHMYAPFSESGMGITGTPGAGRGIVPAANLPVPKLVTANPHFTQQPTGMQQIQGAVNAGNMVSGLYSGGKKGLLGAPAGTYTQDGKTYQQAASTGPLGAGGNYDPNKGWFGPSDTPAAAAPAAAPDPAPAAAPAQAPTNGDTPPLPQYRGGLVREHHADGNAAGDDMPYDNSTAGGYMSGLGLSGSTLSPQQLKSEQTDMAAGKMPGQPPSGAMQGLQAASTLYSGAKLAGKGYDAATSAIGKLGASPAAYSGPIGPGMANMPGGLLPAGGGTAAPAGVAGAAAPAAEAAAPAAAAATPAIEAGGLSGAAGGAGAAEAAGAGAEAAGAAAADTGAAAAGTAATAGLADAGAAAAGSSLMDFLPLMFLNHGGVVPRAYRADGGPLDLDALSYTPPSDQAASVVDQGNSDFGGVVPADVVSAPVVSAPPAGQPTGLVPAARVEAAPAPVAPSAPQGGVAPTPTQEAQPDVRQPRSVRNNNPGNISDGPFAKSMPGYAGSDGRFAIFQSPEHGFGAMDQLLSSYGSKGLVTPTQIISRWAPASDNNRVGAYAGTVAKRMGIGPNDAIDMSDPDARRQLAMAMARFEGGGKIPGGASRATYSGPIGPGMANMPGGLLPAGGGTAAPAGVAQAGASSGGIMSSIGVPRAYRAGGGPLDGGSVDLDALLNTPPSDQAASVVDPFNPDLGGVVPANVVAATSAGKPADAAAAPPAGQSADVVAATSAGKPADVVAATSAGKPADAAAALPAGKPAGLGPAARVEPAAPMATALDAKSMYNYLKANGASDNEATMVTSSAHAESGFQPNISHDGGIGYGLFGHNGSRLVGMHDFAQQNNMPINDWHTQALYGLNELRSRPEAALVNSAKTPEDLTKAQMFYERPKGFSPDSPQSGLGWDRRLASTSALMNGDFDKVPAARGNFVGGQGAGQSPSGGVMSSIGNGLANAAHAVGNLFSPSQANAQTPNQQGGQQQQGTDWEKILVPLASGLAGMASSPSRYLGSAILQGLGAGATGYENVMANQANRAQTGAQTDVQQTVAAQNAANIAKNSSYNDPATGAPMIILANGHSVTRVQWIKMGSPPRLGEDQAGAAINKMSGTPNPAQSTVQPPVAPPNAPAPGGEAAPAPATPWGLGAAGRARIATDVATMANYPFQKDELTAQNAALNKQVSENYANAGDTTAMLNNLTKQILAEPDSGIASAGAISGIKNIALNGWNSIIRSIPGGDQYQISPNEMGSATYAKKITDGLAFAQSNKASQNNLQGLATALSAQPGNTIPKPVALNIVSSLYADKQKAIDEYKYLQEYKQQAALSDPNGMGFYSTENARAAFNQEHNSQQYATEKHAFRNLLAPVDANDNPVGKPAPMAPDATGKPVHLFNLAVNPELTPRGPKVLPQIERYAGSPGLTRWMRNN